MSKVYHEFYIRVRDLVLLFYFFISRYQHCIIFAIHNLFPVIYIIMQLIIVMNNANLIDIRIYITVWLRLIHSILQPFCDWLLQMCVMGTLVAVSLFVLCYCTIENNVHAAITITISTLISCCSTISSTNPVCPVYWPENFWNSIEMQIF